MTETAGARAGARKSPRGKGVTVERIFTTPGVHPYDEVTWEKRDVVQQNWKTGETIFEQRGVEFPSSWSVNASTIVTTMYFRGALGSPQREDSLRTLIDHGTTGYLVDERDPVAYAAFIDQILGRPELATALGANASSLAGGYTWSTTAARLRRLYADLTARSLVQCA